MFLFHDHVLRMFLVGVIIVKSCIGVPSNSDIFRSHEKDVGSKGIS